VDGAQLPAALVPSEPVAPDKQFERAEVRDRIRAAIASLPPRERKVVGLYYYGEATMKQIGAEIGVNESRVSQLHARAILRLKKALGADAAEDFVSPVIEFQKTMRRLRMAKMGADGERGVLLQYKQPDASAQGSRRLPMRAPRAVVAAAR
jgi:RNA polymerase sigma factor for flagellar operon FliA